MNVLFATSECFPLIKTGGLADVAASLSAALCKAGVPVTLMMPGYRSVRQKLPAPSASYRIDDAFVPADLVVLEHRLPQDDIRLLLVDCPSLFDRPGGPYVDADGRDWPDNALRFGVFCRAVVALLAGRSTLQESFSVVHCNDWQTGLIPAFVRHEALSVKTVLTIHNLAYQGIFSRLEFEQLALPEDWWAYDSLEFYGNFSFLKAGIVYADAVTTVSPTYAQEILQEPLACGMSGLLQYHQHKLQGILNGADYELWNPAQDPLIRFHFDADNLPEKLHNKLDLQRQFGLQLGKSIPLIGLVSRLVHQKGVDWIIDVMTRLAEEKVQWIVLGAGDKSFEQQLLALASQFPRKIAVTIGYDESLAHRIEAGADLFVMPSRYEPCGLNQIYSLRYGTLPIVRATGGLADTVTDTDADSLKNGTATGFVFEGDTSADLEQCVRRAIGYFGKRKTWDSLQRNAMARQFDWESSARQYMALYQ